MIMDMYLVVAGDYSDTQIIGLFVEASIATRLAEHCGATVMPFTLDALAGLIREGWLPWRVDFDPDGSVTSCVPIAPPEVADVRTLGPDAAWNRCFPTGRYDWEHRRLITGCAWTALWAKSREHAVELAKARYDAERNKNA
jgi:hypothetical protein